MLRGLDFILRAAGAMEDFWPGSERSTVHFRKMEKQQGEFGTISQVKAHRGSGSNQEMLRRQTQFSRDWMLRAERQSRPRKKVSCLACVTLGPRQIPKRVWFAEDSKYRLAHELELCVYPDNSRTAGQERWGDWKSTLHFLVKSLKPSTWMGFPWRAQDRTLRDPRVCGASGEGCTGDGKEQTELRQAAMEVSQEWGDRPLQLESDGTWDGGVGLSTTATGNPCGGHWEQTEWRAWSLISRVRNQQVDSKGEQGHQ